MAHEILSGKPYTYLDDAPLEERRTRAVTLRRALPESARELGSLDPDAIARVREEAWPQPRDTEEAHDALLSLVVAPAHELAAWAPLLEELVDGGRAATVRVLTSPPDSLSLRGEGLRTMSSLPAGGLKLSMLRWKQVSWGAAHARGARGVSPRILLLTFLAAKQRPQNPKTKS